MSVNGQSEKGVTVQRVSGESEGQRPKGRYDSTRRMSVSRTDAAMEMTGRTQVGGAVGAPKCTI